MTQMEMNVLEHRASLTPVQHAHNDRQSARTREELPPLQVTHIGPDDIKKMDAMKKMENHLEKNLPYMMNPASGHPSQDDGGVV